MPGSKRLIFQAHQTQGQVPHWSESALDWPFEAALECNVILSVNLAQSGVNMNGYKLLAQICEKMNTSSYKI